MTPHPARVPFGKALFAAALCWLAVGVVPRLAAPWAWDDLTVIAYNPALGEPGAFGALAGPGYFTLAKEFSWRPASTFLHVLGAKLFAARPFGHRLISLLLHLAAVALLVACLRRWGLGTDAAFAAGALFAAHPVHLETLLCVAFNEELLVLLGWTLGWYGRLRWREGRHAAGWQALSVAGFALALLSKETGLLGLPVLLLLERGAHQRTRWRDWAGHAAAAAVFLVLRFGPLQGPAEGAGFPTSPPLLDRLYFAGAGLWAFLRTAVLPYPLRLEYFAVPPEGTFDLLAGALGWACAAAAGYVFWRRKDRAAAGAAWALLALLPALNLLPAYSLTTRAFAERWAYVPLAGLCVALAALLPARAFDTVERRWAAGLWAGLLAILFTAQAPLWSNEIRLWDRLVAVYPWSAKAHEGLGQAFFRQGHFEDALVSFETGLELRETAQDRVLAYYVPMFDERAAAAGVRAPLGWVSSSAHRWLARTWLALGEGENAAPHLAEADALAARGL